MKIIVDTFDRIKNTNKLLKCPSAVNCRIGLKLAVVNYRGKPRQLTAEVLLQEQTRHRSFQNSIVTFIVLLGVIFSHSKTISITKTSKFFESYSNVVLWLNC